MPKLEMILKILVICELIFLKMSFVLPQIQSRIMGGSTSDISLSPYLVQLLDKDGLFCGGVLISNFYVITAAHCVILRKAQYITVVAGATYLNDRGVRSTVYKYIFPPGYKYINNYKDVAVLKLKYPIGGPGIRPIGLCTKAWKLDDDVQVYGWGLTSDSIIYFPNRVRTVIVKTLNYSECMDRYKLQLPKNMFSVYQPGGNDVCLRDGGGPAIINGQFCGVVSSSVGCGRYNNPSIYTNILRVRRFIYKAVKKLSGKYGNF